MWVNAQILTIVYVNPMMISNAVFFDVFRNMEVIIAPIINDSKNTCYTILFQQALMILKSVDTAKV